MHEPLDRWLDPAFADATLGARLFGERGAVRVMHAHLKRFLNPASDRLTTLEVCYRMHGRIVAARMYRPGALPESASGRPFPELDARAWIFPDDPALPRLAAALARVEDAHVVHYRPAVRCTCRGVRAGRAVFGKSFRDASGAVVLARIRALADVLATPAPIGYDADVDTLWTGAVDGHPPRTGAGMRRAARALGALHEARIPGLAYMAPELLFREAAKKIAKLAGIHPELAPRLERVRAGLEARLQALPPPRRVLIHGDCHVGQWIDGRSEATLLDFDELAYGDPAHDVASFAVDLRLRGTDEALVRAWIEAYPQPLDTGWLAWHLDLQTITKVYRRVVARSVRSAADIERALAVA